MDCGKVDLHHPNWMALFRSCPPGATQTANRTNRPDFSGQGSMPQPPWRQPGLGAVRVAKRGRPVTIIKHTSPPGEHTFQSVAAFDPRTQNIGSARELGLGFRLALLATSPPLLPTRCHPDHWQSAVPKLDGLYLNVNAAALHVFASHTLTPPCGRFQGAEIPKRLPYQQKHIFTLPITGPWPATAFTPAHRGFQPPHLHGISYSVTPALA